jgi:hypothetical protein
MLTLLEAIARKMGVDSKEDPDIEVLEQATRPEKLVEQIDASIEDAEADEQKAEK